jgi:hypothetical protein
MFAHVECELKSTMITYGSCATQISHVVIVDASKTVVPKLVDL